MDTGFGALLDWSVWVKVKSVCHCLVSPLSLFFVQTWVCQAVNKDERQRLPQKQENRTSSCLVTEYTLPLPIIEHFTNLVYIPAFLVAFGFDKIVNADPSLEMGKVLEVNPPHFLVIWCKNCKMVPKLQDPVASVVTYDSSLSSFDVNNLPVLNYFPLLPSFRCTGWIQRDHICLWTDCLWKNTYHGGIVYC